MRVHRFMVIAGGLGLVWAAAGCGPSRTEREATEHTRLELEQKSRREAEAANKAITEMNKKLGRKPPELDLGVPPAKKMEPVSPPEHRP